jgi:hypothetical protein
VSDPRPGDRIEHLPCGLDVLYRDSSHRYWIVDEWDGEKVAKKRTAYSVTSILRILDKGDAITRWAVRITREGGDWEAARDTAGTRGTSIHDALELLATEGTAPELWNFPADDRGYISALSGWWLETKPEVLQTEVIVAHPEEAFAGRFDLLCRIDGKVWLIDLKTSKRIYREAHLQVAAYAAAMEACGYDPPDARGVLRVGEDGSWELERSWASPAHFMAILGAHRALKDAERAQKAMAA